MIIAVNFPTQAVGKKKPEKKIGLHELFHIYSHIISLLTGSYELKLTSLPMSGFTAEFW